jgi:GntR family transcriptional regulator/MocR family aminotransferase
MLLTLDGNGPLYLQLHRAIEALVRGGHARPGERLPSTRDLADELHLSRNTVRAAYELLAADGVLARHRGSGHQVAAVLQTRAGTPAQPPAPPQSRYARRLRDAGPFVVGAALPAVRLNLKYGEPLTNPLLPDLWRRELARSAAYTPLGYPHSGGLLELRGEVAAYLERRRGIDVAPEDLLIVAGTQQALSLVSRVLIDEGAPAVIEDPGYFEMRWVLQTHGAQLVAVPVDRHGLQVDRLPERRPALVYVTPAHQFPLGVALAERRRAELLAYARRQQTWIIEDDYDGELAFDPPLRAPLYGADDADRVVHIGSFSKVLAPSLRLAYLVPPRALRDDFRAAKYLADLGCAAYDQAALATFLRTGGFQRHLRRVVRALRQRRDALVEGLRRHGRGHFRFDVPSAGMHLVAWRSNRSGLDLSRLAQVAAQAGVGVHLLDRRHYATPVASPRALLLGYGRLSPNEITLACRILGECIATLERDGERGPDESGSQ